MSFDGRSPRFWDLAPRDTTLEKIADGFQFTERSWDARQGVSTLVTSSGTGSIAGRRAMESRFSGSPAVCLRAHLQPAEGAAAACEHGNRRAPRSPSEWTVDLGVVRGGSG